MIDEPISIEELAGILAEVRSDRLVSVSEVAERLEVTPDEIRTWVREGLLPSEFVAGRYVFRLADVIDWEVTGRLRLRTPPEVFDQLPT